ncbi:hypothetical protein TSAR_009052 [Trichomalopsis sarcophagae]|uniref:Uncharacterized protein n=1 Tax=Trichomalopsis sarcophagae TaxID=543379 RepID=A0A232EJ76_9HYME|nr:hypothetical protein TSAR_009052 [Trichomalopsis sarcophagae]
MGINMAVRHNYNQSAFDSCWSLTNASKMNSKSYTPSSSTSPVSDLARNLKKNMHIKSPSPTEKSRKIKRRVNQICNQISKIKLSSPPQQQQQLQPNMNKHELDSFCQATTVKKGSKRALEHLETLAPRNVRRKLNF